MRTLLLVGLLATRAHAEPTAMVEVGGGATVTGGPTAAASLATRWGRLGADARVQLVGDTGELAVLVGIGPHAATVAEHGIAWDRRCLGRLATTADRCAHAAVHAATHDARRSGWFGAVAGARLSGGRTELIAALRIHPTADLLGDRIEVGATALVRGRGDQLFVHHAPFTPGWYVRGQHRLWRFVVAGELGLTGLAARMPSGDFTPEVRAIATVGVAFGGEP